MRSVKRAERFRADVQGIPPFEPYSQSLPIERGENTDPLFRFVISEASSKLLQIRGRRTPCRSARLRAQLDHQIYSRRTRLKTRFVESPRGWRRERGNQAAHLEMEATGAAVLLAFWDSNKIVYHEPIAARSAVNWGEYVQANRMSVPKNSRHGLIPATYLWEQSSKAKRLPVSSQDTEKRQLQRPKQFLERREVLADRMQR